MWFKGICLVYAYMGIKLGYKVKDQSQNLLNAALGHNLSFSLQYWDMCSLQIYSPGKKPNKCV